MRNNFFPRAIMAAGLIVTLIFAVPAVQAEDKLEQVLGVEIDLPGDLGLFENERNDGGYFSILDEAGNILDKTARHVYPGDEFIAENNMRYRVKKVSGDKAVAEMLGQEKISWSWKEPWDSPPGTIPVQAGGTKNFIGIYSTHSDESYVPTDGSDSIPGKGGIFKVGEAFLAKLNELGVNADYDRTIHEPHDANAYRRSRRTAVKLLQKGPAALVDVHRDGVPDPSFYLTEVKGQPATKVRLVVGRQNQNMPANLDFAKRLKAYLDEKYPGFVKGIFMAKGNYNQDLGPRTILIELGTHTNERSLAEKGGTIFAEALPAVLGINTSASQAGPNVSPGGSTTGDWSALLWVLGVVIIGGLIFLVISTGSIEGAKNKFKEFTSREWANYFGKDNRVPSERVADKLDDYLRDQEKLEKKMQETNDQRADYQKD